MKVIPYNVRTIDTPDGTLYQPYLPAHPYIGCPAYRSRRDAVEYIANSCGFSYEEFARARREKQIKLCSPNNKEGRRYVRACG